MLLFVCDSDAMCSSASAFELSDGADRGEPQRKHHKQGATRMSTKGLPPSEKEMVTIECEEDQSIFLKRLQG